MTVNYERAGMIMEDKITVTYPSMPLLEEYIEEIRELWDSHWLTNMGKKHIELQNKMKTYLKASNVELLTNGHMALELTLQSMKLHGEVITTPFTFISTTHAIVRSGLSPVFCDIEPETYTIDASKIKELITSKTCAIMPVHVYGNICNVNEIQNIADKYGLKVIYDAAHAFGEEYDGKGIASYGDVSCFSFHATKVFHTIEGGAVCFDDLKFGATLQKLKNFGIQGAENVAEIGTNAKMNEFCAAMGICNLRHADEEIKKRKEVAERYMDCLERVPGLRLPVEQQKVRSNYAYFPVVIEKTTFGATRDDVYNELKRNGIGSRKYFFPLTSMCKCYQGRYDEHETPVARYISSNVLSLPMFADLQTKDIDRICKVIKDIGFGKGV